MDFSWSEDQQSLQGLAAQIFADTCSDESIRQFAESGQSHDPALWALLAEAGLLGLGIAEADGGTGFGMAEIGLLMEEQGRFLAPVPLHATLALVARPLALWGTDAQRQLWLPRIASGDLIATAAIEETANAWPECPAVKGRAQGDGWLLDGSKTAVPYGAQAGLILVIVELEGRGPSAVLLSPNRAGISVGEQKTTGAEPHAEVTFFGVELHAEDVLGRPGQGADVVRTVIRHGRVGLAAMQLGVTGSALHRTAAYTSERIQFGRPIGSMQAVQQRAADGYIDLEALRSSTMHAAWALDNGCADDAGIGAAKYWAATAGHRITHTAQHLHGGIGADITYPLHRYFLRARQIESALGGASLMAAAIGQALASGQSSPLSGV
ncbi:acyl-CoA dehydrogenase family protein [Novosphingobium sp. ES2-1]|uniref:acyl-CoA dehydrogenase family protein n=1 Tax=Novosphingobium sp. ES2-1 TaxID=2780074 RepID=UPI00187E5246|nr:acyl-CoA dehydrogenase [Novosphingobium sp. ES2-1]QOV96400.1 acyl-CoA dehydrogenase [Novosphingobium sp. ES2-1]